MLVVFQEGQNRRLIRDGGIDGVGKDNGVFFPRVMAAAKNGVGLQRVVRDAQPIKDRHSQGFFGMINRKTDFSQSQHTGKTGRCRLCRGEPDGQDGQASAGMIAYFYAFCLHWLSIMDE